MTLDELVADELLEKLSSVLPHITPIQVPPTERR